MSASIPARVAWPLLRRRLVLRLAVYAMLALSCWQLASLVDLVFSVGRDVMNWTGMILGSGFAICLVWPPEWEETRKEIRGVDPESLVEAYLEAPTSPARSIIEGRLSSLLPDRAKGENVRSRRATLRWHSEKKNLVRLFACTIAIAVAVQTIGFLRLGQPLWGAVALAPAYGTQGRLNERGESGVNDARKIPNEDESANGRDSRDDLALSKGHSRNEDFRGGAASGRPEDVLNGADATRMSPRPQSASEVPGLVPGRANPEGGQTTGSEPGSPAPDATMKPDSPSESMKNSGPTEARAGQGWDKTPDTKISSPIVEYRSWMERQYVERVGRMRAPTGSLAAASVDILERELFESFTVPGGMQRDEDPYLLLLRTRWRDAKGRFR